jgi:hypothetical protein
MNQKKKSYPSEAVKVIVAAGALAGSVGLWSLFSTKSIESANLVLTSGQSAGGVVPAAHPQVVNTPFQPVPTATPTEVPSLRVVNIDFAGMPTASAPVIQRVVINTGGSGSSAGSSSSGSAASAPAPVTNTKTS